MMQARHRRECAEAAYIVTILCEGGRVDLAYQRCVSTAGLRIPSDALHSNKASPLARSSRKIDRKRTGAFAVSNVDVYQVEREILSGRRRGNVRVTWLATAYFAVQEQAANARLRVAVLGSRDSTMV